MTGSFTHLLSVSFVVILAHVTADLLRARPIYDSLLLRMLRKCDGAVSVGKILLEGTVCPGSPLDGRRLREASLPEGCLLVTSTVRGGDSSQRGHAALRRGTGSLPWRTEAGHGAYGKNAGSYGRVHSRETPLGVT
jgi:hypothetical protein